MELRVMLYVASTFLFREGMAERGTHDHTLHETNHVLAAVIGGLQEDLLDVTPKEPDVAHAGSPSYASRLPRWSCNSKLLRVYTDLSPNTH
jgi:hypothetical protein